jgi:hypothetical protein
MASILQSVHSAEFPEERFAPRRERADGYREAVERGRLAMAGSRVVICGLARNIGGYLPLTIARIERLGRMFADYRVFIYENDSTDETPQRLAQWAAVNPRVVVASETQHKPRHASVRSLDRAADMAAYRDRCQHEVAARWPDFEHVAIVDTDLPDGWSYDGVAHSFGSSPWDFVGSYGIIYQRQRLIPSKALHYDVWAFRPLGSFQPLESRAGNELAWRRGDPLVPVNSCFGGLGLYRMPAWLAARYQGGDCEHVPLHREMRERGYGRLFLNPSQIALYGRKRKRLDGLILGLDRVFRAVALCISA